MKPVMIALASIQRTAEDLMARAAIEIPDDYLEGLRRCADTEKGDLSAFEARSPRNVRRHRAAALVRKDRQ
jgi:hypothetical protein